MHFYDVTTVIFQELLYNKHLYLDGSKLEKTGFQLERPYIEIACLQEVTSDYVLVLR